jgi:tetratricopeptide (TPR) repeat protein
MVFPRHRLLQFVLVISAIAGCLFIIQAAARHGYSQLLITYSLTAGNLSAANKAIQVTPRNAEAYRADAALLTALGTPNQAVIELERAVALRPADYVLWSQLGLLRDQTGDSAGALKAFDEAVKRAPFYSQPRWDRGNVLLRGDTRSPSRI